MMQNGGCGGGAKWCGWCGDLPVQWQQQQVNEVDNVYDEATAYMYHSVYDEANHMTYDGAALVY